MQTIDQALSKLKKSEFRAGFHLNREDIEYIDRKGMDEIKEHAARFVRERISPAVIPNDGKQTPMRGHPVFKAMHACACCCRGCLEKWYRVPKDIQLSQDRQERLVRLLMEWIRREYEREKGRM